MKLNLRKKICFGLKKKKDKNNNKIIRIKNTGGRNNQGKITINNRGGGTISLYKFIDFKRKFEYLQIKKDVYDSTKKTDVSFCLNSYILAPNFDNYPFYGVLISKVNLISPKVGDCTILRNIPVGSFISNVELKPFLGGRLSRGPGSFCKLVEKYKKTAKIVLSSGEQRLIGLDCRATLGKNKNKKYKNYRKAGELRWLGFKPSVRGVAMNPVDHPHGGGQGKTSGGRHSVNSLGRLLKGTRTRKKEKQVYILKTVRESKK